MPLQSNEFLANHLHIINFFHGFFSLSSSGFRQNHRLNAAFRWKTKSTTLFIAFIGSLTLLSEWMKNRNKFWNNEYKFRWCRKINYQLTILRLSSLDHIPLSGNKIIKMKQKQNLNPHVGTMRLATVWFLFIAGVFPIIICLYAFKYWICSFPMPVQWVFFYKKYRLIK